MSALDDVMRKLNEAGTMADEIAAAANDLAADANDLAADARKTRRHSEAAGVLLVAMPLVALLVVCALVVFR